MRFILFGNHFSLSGFAAVKSAQKHIQPDRVFMHIRDFPSDNELLKRAVEEFNVTVVPARNVQEIFGYSVGVPAHRSDVLRMEILLLFGGIYMDLDVFALKSVDELLQHEFVIGKQQRFFIDGLCNGILMAKPCSRFMLEWRRIYQTFIDERWEDHSVILPWVLSQATTFKNKQDLMHIEETSFHGASPEEVFSPTSTYDFSQHYFVHLWSSAVRQKPELFNLYGNDFNNYKAVDSPYSRLMKSILEEN